MTDAGVHLVRWPEDEERRWWCAEHGIACLLVLRPGTPVPVIDDGEDWVACSADERDVAARLARLRRRGRRSAPGHRCDLPAELTPEQHRVARRLLASRGRLVRRADLPVEDPEVVIAHLRESLAADGWQISTIGTLGYSIEWGS